MEYYKKRNGLLQNFISINVDDLKRYWLEIYKYFQEKGYFKLAETGVRQANHIYEPQFAPSPEQYFLLHLGKKGMWPIEENLSKYTLEDIFTVIEMYYNKIANCKWAENEDGEYDWIIETQQPRSEYSQYVNNILKLYKEGYYLELEHGFIMSTPNEALRNQLEGKHTEIPDEIYERLKSACNDFYRFNSTEEGKRKAIASLADILEQIRQELQDVLNSEYGIDKKKHDACIFNIVNNFYIRHDNKNQKKSYSQEIWYDWMMQYYTSTIITYYRLIKKHEKEE